MNQLTLKINSNEEIWELLDKTFDNIFIHKFIPNEVVEWWKTDLKIQNGVEFKNLSVRQLQVDIQTNLKELKKIIELNTRQLRIYQFDKSISDTLEIDKLPEKNRTQILKQNGLKHFFFVNFEFITVGSFDSEFISKIESHSKFKNQITKTNY